MFSIQTLGPQLVSLLEEVEEPLEAQEVGEGFECSLLDLSSAHYLLQNCCWDVSSYLLDLAPTSDYCQASLPKWTLIPLKP